MIEELGYSLQVGTPKRESRRVVRPGAVLFLGLFLLIGCGDGELLGPAGLMFEATVTPSTFRVGDSVSVQVTLRNVSARTRTIDIGDCPPYFFVTNSSEQVIAPGYRLCSAISRPRELQPGEHHRYDYRWNGDARGIAIDVAAVLTPGSYKLHPGIESGGAQARGAPVSISVIR